VRQVQAMIKDRNAEDDNVDYSKLGAHEFKVREMEQQVCSFLMPVPKHNRVLTISRHTGGDFAARKRVGISTSPSWRDAQDFLPRVVQHAAPKRGWVVLPVILVEKLQVQASL
jgi:hypothetical protein